MKSFNKNHSAKQVRFDVGDVAPAATPRRGSLPYKRLLCKGCVALTTMAFMALSASAITQEEWEADHSLIPTPSASSPLYVVAPMPSTGAQTVDADMTGIDATPIERTWFFPFWTPLSTRKPGFIMIFN